MRVTVLKNLLHRFAGKSLHYVAASILIILWITGYFFLGMGAIIHLLLLLALILILLRMQKGTDFEN